VALPAPHFVLVAAPEELLSSYDRRGRAGGPRAELVPLHTRATGMCPPWMFGSLRLLQARATARGLDLRFTELQRAVTLQMKARARYLAGQGPKAAPPGQSAHGWGGALDAHTGPLAASGCTLADWHELLAASSMRPIIPTNAPRGWATSESWHADCWGPLEGIRRREGYSQAAIAGHLLCGTWDHLVTDWGEERVTVAVVQAGLLRAGYCCGAIDGQPGPATFAAIRSAGLLNRAWITMAEDSYALPTHLGEDHVLRSAA